MDIVFCSKCGRGFSVAEDGSAKRLELSLLGCRSCRLEEAGIAKCPRECAGCEHFDRCPVKVQFTCLVCGKVRYTPFRAEAQKAQEIIVLREPDADERREQVGSDENPPWMGPRGCRECRIKRHPAAADPATFEAVLEFFSRTGDDTGLWALVEGVAKQAAVGEKPKGPGNLFGQMTIASD